jgi:hypothetical protein
MRITMPLSKPVRRSLQHTREIYCRGYEREDGMWDIEGTLVDSRTYPFKNTDREYISAGEPLHDMKIRLTVDEDLKIHHAEACTDQSPYNMCPDITPAYSCLEGLSIKPGWRRAIRERLSGTKGCTHLSDMLLGPLAVAAFHTVSAARRKRYQVENGADNKPPMLNTCHTYAADSPVVKRTWPDFHEDGRE